MFGTPILKGIIERIPGLWLTLPSKLLFLQDWKALLKTSWRHIPAMEEKSNSVSWLRALTEDFAPATRVICVYRALVQTPEDDLNGEIRKQP